jgi:glutathione S-transferase
MLQLYFHPFSSYCQKALVAFYEYGIPFEPQPLQGPDSPAM